MARTSYIYTRLNKCLMPIPRYSGPDCTHVSFEFAGVLTFLIQLAAFVSSCHDQITLSLVTAAKLSCVWSQNGFCPN